LAYAPDGTRHQVWFDAVGDQGGAFYASVPPGGRITRPLRLGSDQAEHADVAVQGRLAAVVWKQFDGKSTSIMARLSTDAGETWRESKLADTSGSSDHPHLLATPAGILLLWNTQDDGIRTLPLF
jgi:hypothetical protein